MTKPPILAEVFAHQKLALPKVSDLLPCNPSLLANDNNVLCLYPAVNYDLKRTGYLKPATNAAGPVTASEVNLAILNPDFAVTSVTTIGTSGGTSGKSVDRVSDPRICRVNGRTYFLAALHTEDDTSPIGYVSDQGLFEIGEAGYRLVQRFETGAAIEKNWAPISDGSGLAMYRPDPPFVIDVMSDLDPEKLAQHPVGDTRGGTNIEPFRGAYYGIVHRTEYLSKSQHAFARHYGRRTYWHRLIKYDQDFNVVARSGWFSFFGEAIEFATGLILNEDTATIGLGVWDQEAVVLRVSTQDFLDLLA